MSELTLLLLRIGFLVLLWAFVFAVVYSLRADLFGVKVRKMPDAAPAAAAGSAASVPAAASAVTAAVTPTRAAAAP
ncbi:MAG TPA: FHA domain-containing protein, partial [Microbacterium sp.]|nr:FHA domain-containing protein [Microbacterium sp.]